MPVFNYPGKEVNIKVVYYGPGLSGKTTNIQFIHGNVRPDFKGKLVSLATQTDRTLFFDFLPMELGVLGGYKIRLHLYTVPGQVHYNATRKLVLKGVDGVVFVADSQRAMQETNQESLSNLEKNLASYGKGLADLPHVIQCNKRDLDDLLDMDALSAQLNPHKAPIVEAVASDGKGVLECLREILRLVMKSLRDQFPSREMETKQAETPPSEARAEVVPEPEPLEDYEAASPLQERDLSNESALSPDSDGEADESEIMLEVPEREATQIPEPEATVALDAPEAQISTDTNDVVVHLPIPGGGEMEVSVRIIARLTRAPVSAEVIPPEPVRERREENSPEGISEEIETVVLDPDLEIESADIEETALDDEFDVEEVIAELEEEMELDALETATGDGEDSRAGGPDGGSAPGTPDEHYDPSFRELQFTDFDGNQESEAGKGKRKGLFGRLRKKKRP